MRHSTRISEENESTTNARSLRQKEIRQSEASTIDPRPIPSALAPSILFDSGKNPFQRCRSMQTVFPCPYPPFQRSNEALQVCLIAKVRECSKFMHRERLKILSPERQIDRQGNNLGISQSLISLIFVAVKPRTSTAQATCKDFCWDSPLLNAQEPKRGHSNSYFILCILLRLSTQMIRLFIST